jgi:hypothetical protein
VGGIAGILNIWFSHCIGWRGWSRLSLLTFTHLFSSFFLLPEKKNHIIFFGPAITVKSGVPLRATLQYGLAILQY